MFVIILQKNALHEKFVSAGSFTAELRAKFHMPSSNNCPENVLMKMKAKEFRVGAM
jgi:hypothetical protein